MAEGLSSMLKRACKKGLFKPWKVGKIRGGGVHLQYAGDSIMFGEACEENIVSLKSVFRCFKWHSRLKIDFWKVASSQLCGNAVLETVG